MLSRWKALRDRSVQAVHDRVEGEASVDAALAALDMEADLLREELAHVGRMRAILVANAGRAAPAAQAIPASTSIPASTLYGGTS